MARIRHVIDGPLPDGPLPDGEIILAPVRRCPKAATWRMTLSALVSTIAEAIPAATAILRSRRNVAVKWEHIRSELLLTVLQVLYSPENLYRRGYRRGHCVCGPGLGHRSTR